jgi:hypothetical protein
MDFCIKSDGEFLSRTPHVLRSLLHDLPDEWAYSNYGPGTWSPHEIVGHLVYGEQTDWIPRTRIILQHGPAVTFEPFDREGHAPLCRKQRLPELLDLFASLREQNVAALRSFALTPQDMARRGSHPSLGSVTLGEMLATWVAHDLNHIAQVCKALAYQHKSEVGPWEQYMSILAPPAPR